MMRTGVVLAYDAQTEQNFMWCKQNGIPTCQLHVPVSACNEAEAAKIRALCEKTGMEITAVIGGWEGPSVWDFYGGPLTIGIVPTAWQASRAKHLAAWAPFAKSIGVSRVNGHMGFIPENPNDPAYSACISAARWVASECAAYGVGLDFETGQETPVTVLRAIEDIGTGNVGVNFDPANLIMYGKANPLDALDILAPHIHGVHAKDGMYPTNPRELGRETPLGEGGVNIEAFVKKLAALGYDGALTIEREISGDQQKEDIAKANALLQSLIAKI